MTDHPKNLPAETPATADASETPVGDLERILREQIDELEDLVREHPLAALGIAAGAGMVAALLLSRR